MLSEYCKHKKSKLFCAFVDFTKAFDSVWRSGLWSKLVKYNVTGKLLNVIKNLYRGVKSCLKLNNNLTDFFVCDRGVRQGENLSPILFSLYLNDLEHYLKSKSDRGVKLVDYDLDIFLQILVLLYADDTVLFAKSEAELLSLLESFSDYCVTWKLDINVDKTKILVFGDRPKRNRDIFIKNKRFEIVDTFKYLGIVFSKNRKFAKAKCHVSDQAKKALFSLYVKIRNLNLPLDCQLKLFDNTVVPLLLYGCEIWGFGDLNCIEKIHTDFLKHILNVKKSTPHCMLYGDLGRFPLSILIKKRIIGFWYRLINNDYNLSSLLYKIVVNDYYVNSNVYSWLNCVKDIFNECGLSYIWYNQAYQFSREHLLTLVESSLKHQYLQNWTSLVNESPKCINYRIYKQEHKFEIIYNDLPDRYLRSIVHFRLCNTHLPIEKGRWMGLQHNDRKCNLCNLNDIGDEFHYLLKCPYFNYERNKFISHVNTNSTNIFTFKKIMTDNNLNNMINLCRFIEIVLKKTKNHPAGHN